MSKWLKKLLFAIGYNQQLHDLNHILSGLAPVRDGPQEKQVQSGAELGALFVQDSERSHCFWEVPGEERSC